MVHGQREIPVVSVAKSTSSCRSILLQGQFSANPVLAFASASGPLFGEFAFIFSELLSLPIPSRTEDSEWGTQSDHESYSAWFYACCSSVIINSTLLLSQYPILRRLDNMVT